MIQDFINIVLEYNFNDEEVNCDDKNKNNYNNVLNELMNIYDKYNNVEGINDYDINGYCDYMYFEYNSILFDEYGYNYMNLYDKYKEELDKNYEKIES
jgi:hypothetical protein